MQKPAQPPVVGTVLTAISISINLIALVVVILFPPQAEGQNVQKPVRLENPYDQIGVEQEENGVFTPVAPDYVPHRRNREKPAEQALLRYLLDNYDRRVRPVRTTTQVLNVTFGLALSQIIDVDEKNQVVTTNCWLNQHWLDFQLKWDPNDFGGIRIIRLPYNTIWLPDILLYNNADVMTYVSAVSTNVIAQYDGNVTWLSMMIFKRF